MNKAGPILSMDRAAVHQVSCGCFDALPVSPEGRHGTGSAVNFAQGVQYLFLFILVFVSDRGQEYTEVEKKK